MRLLRYCTAIVALTAFLSTSVYGQFSEVGLHARISDMANAEANGGGDTSLIGINPGGVNNWGINQWDLSSIAGETVTEVTLTFNTGNLTNTSVRGSTGDTISLHQMYSSNAGWLEGGQVVNGTNVQTAGAATYNFQGQTSETAGTAWKDANGVDVANFLGSFDPTPIDSVPGYASDYDPRPATIEFTIPIALAQSWVDDPASFAGLVLVSNDDGDGAGRFNFQGNPAILSINPTPPFVLGDVDMNGVVNFLDIQPFIAVLTSGVLQAEADIDMNGAVNFLDIQPFIGILTGP